MRLKIGLVQYSINQKLVLLVIKFYEKTITTDT